MSDTAKGGKPKPGGKSGEQDAAEAPPGNGGETGMSKPDMKKLLIRAQREPVNCALALGSPEDGSLGIVLLDKTRPAKTLAGDLKKQFPGARKPCFGTVSVNPDQTPRVAVFSVNKPQFGLDRKLRKTLRGTGIKNVEVGKGAADASGE